MSMRDAEEACHSDDEHFQMTFSEVSPDSVAMSNKLSQAKSVQSPPKIYALLLLTTPPSMHCHRWTRARGPGSGQPRGGWKNFEGGEQGGWIRLILFHFRCHVFLQL